MTTRKSQNIPMASPDLTDAEIAAVNQVLSTRHLSIGPQIEAFEQAFATYTGTRQAVGVNSGTSGLHLAMIAAGVKEGDLVITTPFSFVASANCILYERAIPVFVDIDPLTGNIDPALAAEGVDNLAHGRKAAERWLPPSLRNGRKPAIYSNQRRGMRERIKAILPVHAFGQPADMAPILEIGQKYDLAVIEDACEAVGAEYQGRMAGALSDAAVFAFYPNKQMTTGEGGLIVTRRDDWATLFRSLRNQGRDTHDAWLRHTRLGYNYRLDEMSAALGVAQLSRIEEILSKRERVAGWYNERLSNVDGLRIPYIAPTTTRMSWFVYVVQVDEAVERDAVMTQLKAVGIPSRQYFSPIHLQPFYIEQFGYQRGDFPVTERWGNTCLALPFSGVMTEDQVDYVCTHLTKIVPSKVK